MSTHSPKNKIAIYHSKLFLRQCHVPNAIQHEGKKIKNVSRRISACKILSCSPKQKTVFRPSSDVELFMCRTLMLMTLSLHECQVKMARANKNFRNAAAHGGTCLRQWSRVNFCSADSSRVRQALCRTFDVLNAIQTMDKTSHYPTWQRLFIR